MTNPVEIMLRSRIRRCRNMKQNNIINQNFILYNYMGYLQALLDAELINAEESSKELKKLFSMMQED